MMRTRYHEIPWSHVIALALCAASLLFGPAQSQAQQGRQLTKARVAERVGTFDANRDGRITREEFKGPAPIFRQIDKDGNAVIGAEELAAFAKEEGTITIGGPGERQQGNKASGSRPPAGGIPATVKALSEMSAGDHYKGEDGGLYGEGRNTPPPAHLEAARQAARAIQPLDRQGKPARDGRIGFISFGMSNTTQEFQAFLKAIQPVKRAPGLVVVDGAQGGMEARAWAAAAQGAPRDGRRPWEVLAQRLNAAGVSPAQVQVVWVKLAVANPAPDGEFPAHARKFQEYTIKCLQELKSRYPNIRLAYLSNRIYAGYAVTPLNPEPYAYEYAYALRWIIQDQAGGKPELNYDPAKGAVKAPLVLWGPDLWANGTAKRKDGLSWSKEDLGPDGTHPSEAGRAKVAGLLLNFLQTDPTARIWFSGH